MRNPAVAAILEQLGSLVRSRRVQIVIAVFCLALVVWLVPRRVDRVTPVTGNSGWDTDAAPPRREIVWETPQSIKGLLPEDSPGEIITPRLSDRGGTLYFSRRDAAGRADILRSRRQDGRWTEPQPMDELNSPFDDVGPALSADARQLYFYSDRAGGRGGFDLYVSNLTDSGWSPPQNLGPSINGPGNEYDPAISPDGRTLFFASDRAERFPAGEPDGQVPVEWRTTLRVRREAATFDLYVAERSDAAADWRKAEALVAVNQNAFNEGAPCVSPDGAFLYFASDRPARTDEPVNLDLYRVRWHDGSFGTAENLGASINTVAHETEPALSPEGFTLVFASNRDGSDHIYASTATEIDHNTRWDTTHLGFLTGSWWIWLLLLLTVVALAWLVNYYRDGLGRIVWATRFLMSSAVLHVLLLLLLGYWLLPDIVEVLVVDGPSEPAPQVFQDAERAENDGRESWEKVADLEPFEPTSLTEPQLPEAEPLTVPERAEHLFPTIPPSQARQLPPEQVIFTPPQPTQSNPVELMELQRQVRSPVQQPYQLAEVTDPPLPQLEQQQLPDRQQSDVDLPHRQPTTQPVSPTQTIDSPMLPMRTVRLDVSTATLPEAEPAPHPTDENLLQRQPVQLALHSVEAPAEMAELPSNPDGDASASEPNLAEIFLERADPVNSGQPAPSAIATEIVESPVMRSSAETGPVQESPTPVTGPVESPLARATSRAMPAVTTATDEVTPPLDSPMAESESTDSTSPVRDLASARMSRPTTPTLEARAPTEITDALTPGRHESQVAAVSESTVDARPKYDGTPFPLSRPAARTTQVAFAEETVPLRSLMVFRDGATRGEYIEILGGTTESEEAVDLGLQWLAKQQEDDGRWSLHEFHKKWPQNERRDARPGNKPSDTAATGLALLPFLAAGHTPDTGEYQQAVAHGINWLLENQKPDGDLFVGGNGQTWMYSHGIAAIALCEAYGMTGDPRLMEPAERALAFIVEAQIEKDGGWRYRPNDSGSDTSVVGWQMMALKSGEMAGLEITPTVYERAHNWLRQVEGNQPVGGQFGYNNRGPKAEMTAEGLLCLQFLGIDHNDPRMLAGAEYLRERAPQGNQNMTSYGWYYGMQVMYHMGGEHWESWNEPLRDLLIEQQQTEGPLAGSWTPDDQYERTGGRIYTSALKLLMLEVYYRHIPLYNQAPSPE